MSGSIGIDYSALLPSTDGGIGSSLLGVLFGTAASGASSPGDALSALQSAEANQTSDIAAVASQTSVARDVAAFKAGVAAATTPDALLSNPAVLKVLLTANGLGDQIAYPALAKKALLSDPTDTTSLADTLSNTAWKSTATTYAFASQGLAVIQQPAVQQKLADAYAEVQWRSSLDASHPGLSNALTFRSEASTITSVDQILGDSVMRDVVTTALGIPEEIAIQPLEAQEKAISSQLDVTKFSDPAFVESFTQRYLVAKATAAQSSSTASNSLESLAVGLVV